LRKINKNKNAPRVILLFSFFLMNIGKTKFNERSKIRFILFLFSYFIVKFLIVTSAYSTYILNKSYLMTRHANNLGHPYIETKNQKTLNSFICLWKKMSFSISSNRYLFINLRARFLDFIGSKKFFDQLIDLEEIKGFRLSKPFYNRWWKRVRSWEII
jgi:hypothetical protein